MFFFRDKNASWDKWLSRDNFDVYFNKLSNSSSVGLCTSYLIEECRNIAFEAAAISSKMLDNIVICVSVKTQNCVLDLVCQAEIEQDMWQLPLFIGIIKCVYEYKQT